MRIAVIFDLDETLVSMGEPHFLALQKALMERSNYKLDKRTHDTKMNALPTKIKLKMLAEEGSIKEEDISKIESLKQVYTRLYINALIKFDREKVTLCRNLRDNGFKIGLVTNSIRATAELVLKKMGLIEYFNVIVSGSDVYEGKPSSEGYKKALEILQVESKQAIAVEDSPVGLKAANGALLPCLIVSGPSQVTYANIIKFIKDQE